MTRRSGYVLAVVAALVAAGVGVIGWWSSQPGIDELLEEAQAARRRGEYARAVELYDRVAERGGPDQSAQAHTQSALLLLQSLARLDESEKRFRRAIEVGPDHVEANRGLAMVLAISGRRWEAVPVIRRVLQSGATASSDGTEIDLLRLMDVGGGVQLESAVLDAALSRDRDEPVALMGLAAVDLKNGRFADAVDRARRALALRADLAVARSMIGRGLLEAGRLKELVTWHRQLPETANGDPWVWVIRGEFQLRAEQHQAAARCFWEALKLHPDHRRANYRLGELLRDLDREADAAVFLDRAADLQILKEIDDLMMSAGGIGSLELLRRKVGQLEKMGRTWEAWGWARVAGGRDASAKWVVEALARIEPQLEGEDVASVSGLTRRTMNPALSLDLRDWSRPEWSVSSIAGDPGVGAATLASFRDDSVASGLEFRFFKGDVGNDGQRRMFEFTGGGVAVLDYDADGWPDVYLAQGTDWPVNRADTRHTDRLFRNRGDGRFEDVTESAGLEETGFGQGVAAGDIDGDGWPDLHVANIGGNRLYINNRDGTFHDATDASGLPGDDDASWSTSCTIADIDGDGHADIYVVNYLSGSDLFTRVCRDAMRVRMCQPFQFAAATDRLYLGRGDGTFRDVTNQSGIDAAGGKGLGVVVADLDDDGRLEVFVANDTRANFLFRSGSTQKNEFGLAEIGLTAGVGLSGDGRAEGSMGVAAGDADGDGRVDLFVTNFLDETNTLYTGIGRGRFSDRSRHAGLASSSLKTLGFGTQFLDADLDGDLDLLVTNGHVDDYSDIGRPHRMATQYYRNRGDGRFEPLEDAALGPHFEEKFLGRGLARLDWNRDGRPDAIITALDVPAVLLSNTTAETGSSLVLRLVATGGHRDAIGTRVRVEAGDTSRVVELTSGDGYLASNQRVLLLGLGGEVDSVRVEVMWPGRASQVFDELTVDREWTLVEGRGRAISLPRPIE